jgi:hypothetical protein
MSGYYTQVMMELRKSTGLWLSTHYSNSRNIEKALSRSSKYPSSVMILSDLLGRSRFDSLEYRGSITLRDPRDLIVSGYYYHLKTSESWARSRDFNWQRLFSEPIFIQAFGSPRKGWLGRSYSNVLGDLSKSDGLMLEIARIGPVLRSISQFPFDDSRILKINFEQIIDNEVNAFKSIFLHYGLNEEYFKDVLLAVDRLSAAKTYQFNPHIRSCKGSSWHGTLDNQHLDILKTHFADQIRTAGYNLGSDV